MNQDRRKRLDTIATQVQEATNNLSELLDTLAGVLAEEQEALENMPESFQEGDAGTRAQEAIDAMERAQDAIQGVIDEDPASSLRDAAGV